MNHVMQITGIALLEIGQVLPGAKAAASAGDHDCAYVLVVLHLVECRTQCKVHLAVEAVEFVGTVECERQHAAVTLREHSGLHAAV
jgi:hypothetical protein